MYNEICKEISCEKIKFEVAFMRHWKNRYLMVFFCMYLIFVSAEQSRLSDGNENMLPLFFAEHEVSSNQNSKNEYADRVSAGYACMNQSRVVICGLAHNCAKSLESVERRIEETGGLFKDYRVVLFEYDSDDETREVLKAWQKNNPKVHLMKSEVSDSKFAQNEFDRMANFRNKYLAYVSKNCKKFDYMMVLDMDLKDSWDLDGLASGFASSNWDGMFAYGLDPISWSCGLLYVMNDLAAYVKTGDTTKQISQANISKNYLKVNFRDSLLKGSGASMIPVASAFGGMGIYKVKSLKGSWYEGRASEHVSLHQAMAEKGHGKFYINSSLVLVNNRQGIKDRAKEALLQKKTSSSYVSSNVGLWPSEAVEKKVR
ncbi:MAG: hypothetical protein K2Y01_06135 [Rhabdochlamydiaceae bacterium]|nr:hypothetical protein [Rhabdochlamydiaceae bacterium]